MTDKPDSQSPLTDNPYNRDKWIIAANSFLSDPKAPYSALYSSYIALRSTDKELAEKCRDEAARRHKHRS